MTRWFSARLGITAKSLLVAPLDPSHDLARRQTRRTTHQNVDVILAHHTLYYPDLKRLTRLPHQLAYSLGHLPTQYLVAVLGHPDKVILDLVDRVTSVSVIHAPALQLRMVALKLTGWKPVVLTL
ncbi:hypothetical protein D3C84_485730 [compost metagenome]